MVFEMWHNLILKKYFNLVLWNLEGVQSYKILVTMTAIMLCKGVVFSLQHFQCSSDEYLLSSAVLTDDLSAIHSYMQACRRRRNFICIPQQLTNYWSRFKISEMSTDVPMFFYRYLILISINHRHRHHQKCFLLTNEIFIFCLQPSSEAFFAS